VFGISQVPLTAKTMLFLPELFLDILKSFSQMEEKLLHYAKKSAFPNFFFFLIPILPKIENCALLGYYEVWSVVSSDVMLVSF
jgi:hypothetical protein